MTRTTVVGGLLGVALAFVSSCSAVTLKVVAEPAVGEVHVAHIGDVLVQVTRVVYAPVLLLRSALEARTAGDPTVRTLTVQSGLLVAVPFAARHDCYRSGSPVTITPPMADHEVISACVCFGRRPFGGTLVVATLEDGSNASFEPVDVIDGGITTSLDDSAPSFTREVVYEGRSGQTLKLLYREHSGDAADELSEREIERNVIAGGILEVAGARLEVVEITDTDVTYKVLVPLPARP